MCSLHHMRYSPAIIYTRWAGITRLAWRHTWTGQDRTKSGLSLLIWDTFINHCVVMVDSNQIWEMHTITLVEYAVDLLPHILIKEYKFSAKIITKGFLECVQTSGPLLTLEPWTWNLWYCVFDSYKSVNNRDVLASNIFINLVQILALLSVAYPLPALILPLC